MSIKENFAALVAGSAAHIPYFSSFSLPSRLIVSVGTFITSIENRESRPRKAFVCFHWILTKNCFSVDLVPVSDSFIPFSKSANSIGWFCFVSVNEFRLKVNLLFNFGFVPTEVKGFWDPSSILYFRLLFSWFF